MTRAACALRWGLTRGAVFFFGLPLVVEADSVETLTARCFGSDIRFAVAIFQNSLSVYRDRWRTGACSKRRVRFRVAADAPTQSPYPPIVEAGCRLSSDANGRLKLAVKPPES
jgi:hypothetical protein